MSARLDLCKWCRWPTQRLTALPLQEKALLSFESVSRFQSSTGLFWGDSRDLRHQALQDRHGSDHAPVEVGALGGSHKDMIRPC